MHYPLSYHESLTSPPQGRLFLDPDSCVDPSVFLVCLHLNWPSPCESAILMLPIRKYNVFTLFPFLISASSWRSDVYGTTSLIRLIQSTIPDPETSQIEASRVNPVHAQIFDMNRIFLCIALVLVNFCFLFFILDKTLSLHIPLFVLSKRSFSDYLWCCEWFSRFSTTHLTSSSGHKESL